MEITIGGKKIIVRGLTRGELKKLAADGVDIEKIEDLENAEDQNAQIDRVLELAAPDVNPDDLTPGQCFDLLIAAGEATFLPESMAKNLPKPPAPGSDGGLKKTARTAKKKGSRGKGAATS